MAYAMYLRKSRADAELEARLERNSTDELIAETLERHRKTLTELAHKMNIAISEDAIFLEVVSGESIEARPQVRKLLSQVERGQWEGVFVMEVERLARGDTIDQGIVSRAFKAHGTKIITPIKIYDPADEFDEEYFEFGLFMSRREYKIINRRIQRGRIASVQEGKFISSTPPYGYDKIPSPYGKGYILSPNEEESKVVKRIYEEYLSGNGSTRIANMLTDEGVMPRSTNAWASSSIRDILKNPVYAGYIRWSYKKEIKEHTEDGIKKKRKKNGECILVKGKHTPIISQEMQKQAEKLMHQNTNNTTRKDMTLKNSLSGLVYCKRCGKLMTRVGENSKTPYSALKCQTRGCPTVSAPLEQVEKEILDKLKSYYYNYNIIFDAKKSRKKNTQSEKIKSINKKITTNEKQQDTAYTLLEQGVYSIEVFTQRIEKLKAENKNLTEQRKTAQEEAETCENARIPTKKEIYSVLQLYNKCIDAESKNKLLKTIINRVEYQKDTPNTRGKSTNRNFTVDVYLTV